MLLFLRPTLAFFAWVFLFLSHSVAGVPQHSPTPGGIAVVNLSPLSAELANAQSMPKVSFQGKPSVVRREGNDWVAYIALPLSLNTGEHSATVELAGKKNHVPLTVMGKNYPEQRLSLTNKRQVNPNPEDMRQITEDKKMINRIFNTHDFLPVNLDFQAPINAPLSSRFGLRRYFNNESRAPHSGLDFAASAGSPILAVGEGVVVHTGTFFFNGNSVFVHHGQGVISMYCHLESINVATGDTVDKNTMIGKVGSTGRSTGPHLHLGVYFNGVAVDPELFVSNP